MGDHLFDAWPYYIYIYYIQTLFIDRKSSYSGSISLKIPLIYELIQAEIFYN